MSLPSIINQALAFLAGKKTYLVGAAMVLNGIANQDWNLCLQGLGLMAVRAGIAKA